MVEFDPVDEFRAGKYVVQQDTGQGRVPDNVWSLPVFFLPLIIPDIVL